MLQMSHLLYLAPTRSPSVSAALRYAVYLARSLGATLHLMPLGEPDRSGWTDVLRTVASGDDHGLDVQVEPPVDDPDAPVPSLRAYEETHDVDLVVTGTPEDRGPIPPSADPSTQTLLHELHSSLLVVGEDAPAPPRRILVPTDLSEDARCALDYALTLAPLSDASIDLLHVIEAVPYVALTRVDRLSISGPSFPERRARRHLNAFLNTIPDAPSSLTPHFEFGDPVDQIVRFVNRHEVDLMILSARGAHTSPHSSLGSVADRVLHRVTCPVLLARPTDSDVQRPMNGAPEPSV